MSKRPCVYILASKRNGTLYVGVTSNPASRIDSHVNGGVCGFTKKYNVSTLVYIEACDTMEQAIDREKKLKAGSRKKKIKLIEKDNPLWEDIGHLV